MKPLEDNGTIYRISAAQTAALGMALLLIVYVFLWGNNRQEVIQCSNYKIQSEAQRAFDGDPVKFAALDGYDNDSKACEDLPKN